MDELNKSYIIRKQQVITNKGVVNTIEIPELKVIIHEDGIISYNGIPSDKKKLYLEIYNEIKSKYIKE